MRRQTNQNICFSMLLKCSPRVPCKLPLFLQIFIHLDDAGPQYPLEGLAFAHESFPLIHLGLVGGDIARQCSGRRFPFVAPHPASGMADDRTLAATIRHRSTGEPSWL